jgi:hypothetical protein
MPQFVFNIITLSFLVLILFPRLACSTSSFSRLPSIHKHDHAQRIIALSSLSHSSNGPLSSQDVQEQEFPEDDDSDGRHTREPSALNSSDPPGENASRIPSAYPSSTPSHKPSLSPTQQPTRIPSSSPTYKPSVSQLPTMIQPCSRYGFNFGHTQTSVSMISIKYNYDVETDNSIATFMGVSMTDQIKRIEETLLNLIIGRFFPECNDTSTSTSTSAAIMSTNMNTNNSNNKGDNNNSSNNPGTSRLRKRILNHNIFRPTVNVDDGNNNYNTSTNDDSTNDDDGAMVGMSSRPLDVANGEICNAVNENGNISCHVVEGRLTVFISSTTAIANTTTPSNMNSNSKSKQLLSVIQEIMNNGELNECHPAIVSVRYQNQTELNFFKPSDDDDSMKDDGNLITIIVQNGQSYIIMGIALSLLFMGAVVTRYRYSNHHETLNNSEESIGSSNSDDAFIEINDDDDDDDEEDLDKISSLSMQFSKSENGATYDGSGGSTYVSSSGFSQPQNKSVIRKKPFGQSSRSIERKANWRKMLRFASRKAPPDPPPPDPPSSDPNEEFLDLVKKQTNRVREKLITRIQMKKSIEESNINMKNKQLKRHIGDTTKTTKTCPSSVSEMTNDRLELLFMNRPTTIAYSYQ